MNRGQDEGVFLSLICVGFAGASALKFPSVMINLVFLVMLGWFLWSVYKMTLDRL